MRRRGSRCPISRKPRSEVPVKIASYNIHKCRGADGIVRPDRIIAVIGQIGADVIALQEVDHRFGTRGGLLDPAIIRRKTGMQLLVQSDVPYRHGWHGNALLVRGEPKSYRRSRLRLPGFEPRGAIVAELDLGEGQFRGSSRLTWGCFVLSRMDQARALSRHVPRLASACRPSCSAISTSGAAGRRSRARRSRTDVPGLRHRFSAFLSRRPIFPLDRILGWPTEP